MILPNQDIHQQASICVRVTTQPLVIIA